MLTRRGFLKAGAAAGALGLARPDLAFAAVPRAAAPLRILVLGGTGFIGPHQVRYAIARGHKVTTFTRGRRSAELPEGVEYLTGERPGKLDALKGRTWDAVIDNSATDPAWVRETAGMLRGSADRYMFVSSTGVYLPYRTHGIDEGTEPLRVDDPATGEQKSYGVMKTLAEDEARKAFGDGAVVVRPHYIVGPGDTTDRFPYWPVRIARGGEVLVPGDGSDPVQLIDVRDLAEFMIHLLETGQTGTYNVTGPRSTLRMDEMVYGIKAATTADVKWTWVNDFDFLEKHGLAGMVPWIMPRGDYLGMSTISNRKAVQAGLKFRPLADTARDTLLWWPTVAEARRTNPRFVLTPEKEAEVLAAWKASK